METKCPYCNYIAEQHETLNNSNPNAVPKVGEISFCINCGEVSKFSKNGLIKVDIESLDEDMKMQLKEIDTAWVKTRYLTKLRKEDEAQE